MLALLVVFLLVSQIKAYEDVSSLEYWHKSNDGVFYDYDYDRNLGNAKAARVDKTRDNLVKKLAIRIQDLAREIDDLAQQLKSVEQSDF